MLRFDVQFRLSIEQLGICTGFACVFVCVCLCVFVYVCAHMCMCVGGFVACFRVDGR